MTLYDCSCITADDELQLLTIPTLDVEEPLDLELPNQWLWDIVDEFIYQYESFCRYRSRVDRLSKEERQFLAENGDIWNTFSVLNVLYSLIQKSNINEQLAAMQSESSDGTEVAGIFGAQPLYKMLGYFSLIGLLRVHCMLGDYTVALKMLDNIDMSKKVRVEVAILLMKSGPELFSLTNINSSL